MGNSSLTSPVLPTLSVALASYNGERYIRQQLDSIIGQTLPPCEIVVSDDASSDATLTILREYEGRHLVKVTEGTSRVGVVKNFERAFLQCQGEYIAFSDQDDVWLPDKLEKTIRLLQTLEEKHGKQIPILVFTDLKIVDSELNVQNESYLHSLKYDPRHTQLSHLLVENVATGCTVMVNRALAKWVSSFPSEIAMHDVFLAMVASAFGEIGFLNESTLLYRQHAQNVVGASHNALARIVRNTWSVLVDKEDSARFLSKEIAQAEAFYSLFKEKLNDSQKDLLLQFVGHKKKSKVAKIAMLLKYGIWKGNTMRNVNLLLKI